MAELHDGDTFKLQGGNYPLYAEFLDTNGRLGFRVTDKLGRGVLLEGGSMERLHMLLGIALKHEQMGSLDEFMANFNRETDRMSDSVIQTGLGKVAIKMPYDLVIHFGPNGVKTRQLAEQVYDSSVETLAPLSDKDIDEMIAFFSGLKEDRARDREHEVITDEDVSSMAGILNRRRLRDDK